VIPKPEPLKQDELPEEERPTHGKGTVYFTDGTKPMAGKLAIDRTECCVIIHTPHGMSMYPMGKVRKITWL
jgi:hypothetical protein